MFIPVVHNGCSLALVGKTDMCPELSSSMSLANYLCFHKLCTDVYSFSRDNRIEFLVFLFVLLKLANSRDEEICTEGEPGWMS